MDDVLTYFLERIEPLRGALLEVTLFGSRARRDWRPDSDYDVLVVVRERSRALKDQLYDAVMDVLLEKGKVVSLKVFAVEEYDRLRAIPTPFMERIMKEGIPLGAHH